MDRAQFLSAYVELSKHSVLLNEDDRLGFLAAIKRLSHPMSHGQLVALFLSFRTDVSMPEIQWRLISFIEKAPLNDVIAAYVYSATSFVELGEDWAIDYAGRILNSAEATRYFRDFLISLPSQAVVGVREILERLSTEDESMQDKVSEFLADL
jgi:hypothetical protein